jgi:hypothetical protein
MSTVRWGMLSTAGIGRVVAPAIRDSQEAEFVAVAGRDAAKAAAYTAGLGVARSFGSCDELLASDEVSSVPRPPWRMQEVVDGSRSMPPHAPAPAGRALSSRACRSFAVALALGLLLAVVAPVMADAGTRGGPAAPAGAEVQKVDWTACGSQLECASVPVPLNWSKPTGVEDRAVGDPTPGQPPRRADRIPVRQPRGNRAIPEWAMSPSAVRPWTPSPEAASTSSAGTSAAVPEPARR